MAYTRKQYFATVKDQVVLEVLKETRTVAQLTSEYQKHSNLLTKWSQEAIMGLAIIFERKNVQVKVQEIKVEQINPEIGRLTTQVNWLKKSK